MDGGVGPLAAPPSGWTGGSGTQLPGDLPKALAGGGSRVFLKQAVIAARRVRVSLKRR